MRLAECVLPQSENFSGAFRPSAGAAAAPSFAADTAAGRRVWRLLMPAGGPAAACPSGTGEGEFQPLGQPCTVVRPY